MPLLHIVGISSCNSTFTAALAFLRGETAADYAWSLENIREYLHPRVPEVLVTDRDLALMSAITEAFPSAANLLCTWHIEKNFLAQCKKGFVEDEWDSFLGKWRTVVQSETEDALERNWAEFSASHPPAVIAYIESTWMVHQRMFVHAFVNKLHHFGHLVTSRVEGNHSAIKSWLATSTNDLKGTIDKLTIAIGKQKTEIDHHAAYDQTHTLLSTNREVWTKVNRKISHYGLRKAHQQLAKAQKMDPNDVCSGVFETVHGVPCAHTLLRCLISKVPVEPAAFHAQWHVPARTIVELPVGMNSATPMSASPSPSMLIDDIVQTMAPHQQHEFFLGVQSLSQAVLSEHVKEPRADVVGKGRPVGARNKPKSSTARDLSAFELAGVTTGRKCRACGQSGHNARTCTSK